MRSAVLPAGWLVGVVVVVWVARWPDPGIEQLRQAVGIDPDRAYPLGAVVAIVVSMTIEAGAVLAILRPTSYSRSWGRALTSFVLSLCLFYGVAILGMPWEGTLHPYQSFYAWWMRAIIIGTFALFAWSGLASLPARDPAGKP
jgi:hypothetical protein